MDSILFALFSIATYTVYIIYYSTPTEVFRLKIAVLITEFVRISEVALIIWRMNNYH